MNKFIYVLLLLIPNNIFAQYKISGAIIDENNTPVEFATIVLSDYGKQYIKGDISDSSGIFQLECAQGKYCLSITYFSDTLFHQEVLIEQDIDLGKIIINQSRSLKEVSITAKKSIIRQDFDKLIFNVENSTLSKGYDGLEVLKRSPKLQINADGNLIIRNTPVIVLINGRRLNITGLELNNYLASINFENIKSIEIQTSGNSETDAENGGGVINIILKKGQIGFQTATRTFYEFRETNYGRFFTGINTQYSREKWFAYHRVGYNNNKNKSIYNSSLTYTSFNGENVNNGGNTYINNALNNTFGAVYYPNDKNEIGFEFLFNNNNSNRNGQECLDIYDPALTSKSTNMNTNESTTNFWNATLNYTYKS